MKIKSVLFGASLILTAQQVAAQYIRNPEAITVSTMSPTGVSNDGLVALYKMQALHYYIWNADTNTSVDIGGVAPGLGNGGLAKFSDDGKYLSGSSLNNQTGLSEASRYDINAGQWTTLGSIGFGFGSSASSGYEISGDGTTVVGNAYLASGSANSFAWSTTNGAMDLGSLYNKKSARGNDINGDGSVIVGWQDQTGSWKSAVWRKKPDGTYLTNDYLLVNPNGSATDPNNQLGEAYAVSKDGKLIGGKGDFAMPNAWLWSQESGMVDLGPFLNHPNANGRITAMNNDGTIAVGYYYAFIDSFTPPLYRSFIWLKGGSGIQDLTDYLKNTLGYDLGTDIIFVPNQISANGKYITGWGRNASNQTVVFRAQLPEDILATNNTSTKEAAKLYPNPVNDVLNIDSKTTINNIKIYNTAGQVLSTQKVNSQTININMSQYKSGVYLVDVTSGSESKVYKVIKK